MYCTKCGEKNQSNSVYCKKCGTSLDGDKNSPKKKLTTEEQRFIGLGGWLAVVGLGLLATPIVQTVSMLEYFDYFTKSYEIPGFLGLLQFEFFMAIVFIITSCYLLFVYFKKSKKFPKLYIYFLAATAIYVVADYLMMASLNVTSTESKKIISDTLAKQSSEVAKSIITAIIWINYIRQSKRVKATFIN